MSADTSPEVFDGFTDMAFGVCRTIVGDQRRWAQTGVGWLLRELSRRVPDRVARYLADRPQLSTEARKNATKYLPKGS